MRWGENLIGPSAPHALLDSELHEQYAQAIPRIASKLGSWDHDQEELLRLLHEADADQDGYITWHQSEVRSFARNFFEILELPLPRLPQRAWFQIYREVDFD